MNWNVTPVELLNQIGWQSKRKGNWLTLKVCPFCRGGDHGDTDTFIVHASDGNYCCLRAKCGVRGTFWGLLLALGLEPKSYLGDKPRTKKRGYIYGR